MKLEEQELVQIKKTKFVEMYWNDKAKELVVSRIEFTTHKTNPLKLETERLTIPINKIPQVIRGLFSAYQRFHKKGYVKKAKRK